MNDTPTASDNAAARRPYQGVVIAGIKIDPEGGYIQTATLASPQPEEPPSLTLEHAQALIEAATSETRRIDQAIADLDRRITKLEPSTAATPRAKGALATVLDRAGLRADAHPCRPVSDEGSGPTNQPSPRNSTP